MRKDILINSTSKEIRIAITEDGKLVEFFVESPDQNRNVGDIYLGKVAKVMSGIRAAFIDLGFQQDAFLHFSDINYLDEMSICSTMMNLTKTMMTLHKKITPKTS